jgi:hypothetical protein
VQLGTINAQQNDYATFIDLVDGQQVELVGGPQGGFHVWTLYRVLGSVQARSIAVQILADRSPADGSRQRISAAVSQERLSAEPTWELPAPQPTFLCPPPAGVNVLSAPVALQINVYPAADGLAGQPEPTLVPIAQQQLQLQLTCPPPGDAAHELCLRICQG